MKKIIEEKHEKFEEKRKIGENDDQIVKLIQKDLIDEFKSYVNTKNISLKSSIESSIFETDSFLMKQKETSLIQYATFYGSIQIFEYLKKYKVDLTPSLWIYAIHSNNIEIIQLLEKYHIVPDNNDYEKCFKESVKCHHNNISYYIQRKYLINKISYNLYTDIQDKNELFYHAFPLCFKYYNFEFISNGFVNCIAFFYYCKYDYYHLVKILSTIMSNNINNTIISIIKNLQNFSLIYFHQIEK